MNKHNIIKSALIGALAITSYTAQAQDVDKFKLKSLDKNSITVSQPMDLDNDGITDDYIIVGTIPNKNQGRIYVSIDGKTNNFK